MKKQLFLLIGAILVSVIFTVLIKTVDVQPIGPEGSWVGLASINQVVKDTLGFNATIAQVSDYFIAPIIVFAACYIVAAVIQLIKRKKIDRELIWFGVALILLGVIYIVFEKLTLNFRPVILDDALEASYPSLHTLNAVTLAGCIVLFNRRKLATSNARAFRILNLAVSMLALFVVLCRALSGVHWLTDIIGGLLFASVIISAYRLLLALPTKS